MPLTGWRVLEVSEGPAAAFCAKVLSDLGAEVVVVEPPGGHPSRFGSPRHGDAPTDEPGARFVYLNTGKASVVIDDGELGAERLRALVADADVVVTDVDDDALDALGPVPDTTSLAVIRPFGSTGPYRRHRASHLTVFHSGGEGSLLPSGAGWMRYPNRPPLQIGSDIAWFDAGWNAAIAVLGACFDRLRTGFGQWIDVSVQESQLTLNRTRLSRFTNDGVLLQREGNRYGWAGMLDCADGWVQLVGVTDRQLDALAASPDGAGLAEAWGEDRSGVGDAMTAWCRARPKAEVVRVLSGLGAPVGSHAVPADLFACEQLAHRGFFRQVDDGRGAPLL
ncbi:MAG: CoA transferase, partial [Acidimicrobiales bacterium]|nr:CoA transferase [Acidimicrobiales bacterium]